MAATSENPGREKRPLNPYASIAVGTLVGFVFFFGGYLLAVGNQESFSIVMFLLVPFMSGLTMAAVIRPALLLLACCASTCIFTLTMLIVTGLEGYICCLMALPLLAIGWRLGLSSDISPAVVFLIRRSVLTVIWYSYSLVAPCC